MHTDPKGDAVTNLKSVLTLKATPCESVYKALRGLYFRTGFSKAVSGR